MKRTIALLALLTLACESESNMETPSPLATNPFVEYHKGRFDKLSTTSRVPPSPNLGQRGEWVKTLNAQAPDEYAAPVTINLRAEYELVQGPNVSGGPTIGSPQPLVGQPLVARIRWGVHGAYNVIDFDIPPPNSTQDFPVGLPASAPIDDIGSGVTITLAGSAFEVQVRNDGNLSFLVNPGNTKIARTLAPAKVLTTLTPGQGPGIGRLSRTIYLCGEDDALGTQALAPGAGVTMRVPAFAQRVWFPRIDARNTPLIISMSNNMNVGLATFDLPANSIGPIELTPDMQTVNVLNNGAVNVFAMSAMYEVHPQ